MKSKIILPLLGIIVLCINLAKAQENNWSSGRPDGHAPIGVMGDHYHKKGDLMFSYRTMLMWMSGNLDTSNDISNDGVYLSYTVAPQKMLMTMNMFGMMYALHDNFTLMLMANYIFNSMDLRAKNGTNFTTKSGGLGDIGLSGLVKLYNNNRQSLHANVGISIPIGKLDQGDLIPLTGKTVRLAYPMQLGSGTWDSIIGLTYLGQSDMLSWGGQAKYKFRFGKNAEEYILGNRFDAVVWGAYKISKNSSFSTSLNYFDFAKIDGTDMEINNLKGAMPLFDAVNSSRSQMDVGVGLNYYIAEGTLNNLRLGVEVKFPAYQKVNGIQMKNAIMTIFGIQYSM